MPTSPTAADHEAGLARFLVPQRRERFVASLSAGGKARAKQLVRLAHHPDIDECWMSPIEATGLPDVAAWLASVEARVRDVADVGEVHVIGEDPAIDGMTLPLTDAIEATLLEDAASLISLIPGHVAIYKSESPANPVLLLRP